MATLRLFIAAPCPVSDGLRRVLAALDELRPAVKPAAADGLHLTLRFLGDTSAARVAELSEAIDLAVAEAGTGPIDVHWSGLGRFPARTDQPARVLYAEPANPRPLEQLAAAVDESLTTLAPPVGPPDRPFTAHLTLARAKDVNRRGRRGRERGRGRSRTQAQPADSIDTLCQRESQTDLGGCRITAVQLIASELTSTGPIHRVQHEVML